MICGALLEQGWRVCLVGETEEGGGKTLAKKEVKNEKGKREIQSANCGGEVRERCVQGHSCESGG
jgi:hypothetical protein